jgi:cell division initiation protein
MLTPQDFREKTFEKAIFGGYDMAAVDDFLDAAANDYAALAKDNMVLKSKMKVLVDKIEEYRATEDSMRLTLLSAQKLSTQMEHEAKEKTETLLAEARLEAEQITREAHNQRISEEARLLDAKKASTKYIENVRLACAKQLEFLESLESYKVEIPTPEPYSAPARENVDDTVRIIESSVERLETPMDDSLIDIGRVVQEAPEKSHRVSDEPTRTFPGGAPVQQAPVAAPVQSQLTMDTLRFGK